MTDEQGGEAATVETTTTPPIEAGFSSPEQSSERDFEAEARDMGWRPKEEWTGKPDNWKDARTYVEYDEVKSKVTKVEREYAERFKKLESVTAKTVERLQAAHEKEVAELKAARKEAIKGGDVEEVERLDQAIEASKADAPDKPGKKTDADIQAEWVAENPWYEADAKMRRIALGVSNDLAAGKPDMTLAENLKLTMKALEEEYPEFNWTGKKTTTPAANGHAAVDGGGNSPGAIRADPLAKLPAEARAQAKSDMTKFPKIYPNAEAWVKAYNS